MIPIFFLFIILFAIGMSLRTLFMPTALQEKFISWESFLYLLYIFATIMIGFGLIYFLMLQMGWPILLENGEFFSGNVLDHLFTSIYFSAVTLFSLGYGDVAPVGIGRFVSIVESMIGYTIPAAFVVRTIIHFRGERGQSKSMV